MRIGLLSTARINALGIIQPAKKRHDISIVGVASRTKENAENYAKRYSIEGVFDGYNELICSPNVDAVYISLPNILHYPYIKKCLENNKHVFCEKPITLNLKELIELEALANKKNCYLLDGLHYYLYPALQTIVKDLRKYKSNIKYMEAFLGFPMPEKGDIRLNHTLGGGAHNHLVCYLTHFISWIYPNKDWSIKVYDQKEYNSVDVYKVIRFESQDEQKIIFDAVVSFDHHTIESWINIKWSDCSMDIKHAFTPTTFFDRAQPYKNLVQVITNHPALANNNYSFEGMKSTYDYQLDYFIKHVKNRDRQGVFKEAYKLFEAAR